MAPRQSTKGKKKGLARKPSTTYGPDFLSLEHSNNIRQLDSLEVNLDLEAMKKGYIPADSRVRIEKLAKNRVASTMEHIAQRRRAVIKELAQERSGWRVETRSTPSRSCSPTPDVISKFKNNSQVPISFAESNIRLAVDTGIKSSDRKSQLERQHVEYPFPERTEAIRENEVSALMQAVEFRGSPVRKSPLMEALGLGDDVLRRLPYPLNNKGFLRLYVAPLFELGMGCTCCEERFLAQEHTIKQLEARLLDRLHRCAEIAAMAIAVVDTMDKQWDVSLSDVELESRDFFLCRKAYRELEESVEAEAPKHRKCPYWRYSRQLALLRAEKRVEEQLWKRSMLVENMPEPVPTTNHTSRRKPCLAPSQGPVKSRQTKCFT